VAVRTVLWSRLQASAAQWTGDGWHPSVYQLGGVGKAGRRCIAQNRMGCQPNEAFEFAPAAG
jgi:hypothetical protein